MLPIQVSESTLAPSGAHPSGRLRSRTLALGFLAVTGCVAASGAQAPSDSEHQPADAISEGSASLLPGEANYRDPGTGPWQKVDPSVCGLDKTKLPTDIENYAIFRHGKLCFMNGNDHVASLFSATKTLGGLMVGRAAYLTRNIVRMGPRTGPLSPDDLASYWLGQVSYNSDATLSHVMAMSGHSEDLLDENDAFLDWEYDTVGTTQINTLIDVTKQAIRQIPALGTDASTFVEKQIFDKLGMSKSYWLPVPLGIAAGWYGNMAEMGKLGTLLLHEGWYNGEQLVSREWVYGMSHPAFEHANTSYGHLTWVNHRGNAEGAGGGNPVNPPSQADLDKFGNGDKCAPAAFWPSYPHGLSNAASCLPADGAQSCTQLHDVGVFSAQGLGGQYIVMHPGLDMVLVAHNFNVTFGPAKLWEAVRPALVAMDPVYKNKTMAEFCAAYGAGSYAPNLPMPRFRPTP